MMAAGTIAQIGLLMLTGGAHAAEEPPAPANGGWGPCAIGFHDFDAEVDGPIDRYVRGRTLLSYTQIPSFESEWGVRVYEDRGEYRMLVARFRASVWQSAYREIKPHVFDRDPSVPPPGLWIDDVNLDTDTARLLRHVITREVDGQRASNERMGFDGESHTVKDEHGHCAAIWSPDVGTRAITLVRVFGTFRSQARMPWPLRTFWEQRAYRQLLELAGEPMTPKDWLMLMGLALSVILVASLPMVIGAFTLMWPRRPARKCLFVLACGVLSYGMTCVAGVIVLPIILGGAQVSGFMSSIGKNDISEFLASFYLLSPWIVGIVWILLSISVPIYLRTRGWARWMGSPAQQ